MSVTATRVAVVESSVRCMLYAMDLMFMTQAQPASESEHSDSCRRSGPMTDEVWVVAGELRVYSSSI